MRTSDLEIKVISMDDPSKTAYSVAREAAKKFGARVGTCQHYLQSYRNGYISHSEYTRTSFTFRRVAFCDPKLFEREYDQKEYNEDFDKFERVEKINNMISRLPKREGEVIKARYFMHQTYEAIGKSLNLSKQWIHQIEIKALARLRCIANEMQLSAP